MSADLVYGGCDVSAPKLWRSRRVSFTEDELLVIEQALNIWEAMEGGGDISEDDKEELTPACETALAKIQKLVPPVTP